MTPFKKLLLAGLLVATMVPAVSAEHLVIAAVNEAMRTADTDSANSMSRLTGGLNLGGLF